MTDSVIEAGGIALTDPGIPGVDTVTARRYRHPVLDGERVVVRLVPAALGEAEDLAMEFLGFATAAEPTPVGVGARQALGFPAWALVHDPANGRHALALVKEMERLARLAKAKPGNAKAGYDQLATRLGDAAPHFLPTFWEQAGRAFMVADNAKAAGVCFGEARQAERVHALAIDEARLGEVHLEFALAGALTVKALAQYSRELTERLSPAAAYRQLRTVAVHRVAGGLAPHTGMAEDLARLAKAAGLRPDEEAEAVLEALLALPAIAKAPLGFWKSYRRPLVRLARRSAAVRGRLLAIQPDPGGLSTDVETPWVELLEETGAAEGLTGTVDPAAEPPGGAGAWLERSLTSRTRRRGTEVRSAALIGLVERMVPKLRAEGRVLDVVGSHAWSADLDVLDVLIAGDVPLSGCTTGMLNIGAWLADTGPGARDLSALAGYPGVAQPWRAGVRAALTDYRQRIDQDGGSTVLKPEYLARFQAVPGLRATLTAWLASLGEEGRTLPLAALGDLIDQVAPLHSPAGAAIAPAEVRRLAALDVAPALARTLRAGLAAELCWPAYDEARGRLSERKPVYEDQTWPYLILNDGSRMIVLGPDGIALDHLMHLPPDASPYQWAYPKGAYVDGQLRVQWWSRVGPHAYWSARPDETFDLADGPETVPWGHQPRTVTLPGGGATTGAAPWHAGDRTRPGRWRVASDGVNYWRLEHEGGYGTASRWSWREYDPATGTVGRASRPRFFAEAGEGLRDAECTLLPAPGAQASPLGQADGLVGWRVRTEPDGSVTGEGVDGRRVTLRVPDNERLAGAVRLPGSDEVRALLVGLGSDRSVRVTLAEPGSGRAASRMDTTTPVPSADWWHWAVPRDEAGSRALRAVPPETAARLLKACLDAPSEYAAADDAIQAVLPAVTDVRLRVAVIAEVVRAARHARWLVRFGEHADAAPTPAAVVTVDDGDIEAGVRGLDAGPTTYYYGPRHTGSRRVLPAIAAAADALHGRTPEAKVPPSALDWSALLGTEWALALRAVSPALPEAPRGALLSLLDALARGDLLSQQGRLRTLVVSAPPGKRLSDGAVLRAGGSTLVVVATDEVWDVDRRVKRHHVVQYAPGGDFGPVKDVTILEDRRPASRATAQRVAALLDLAARNGAVPWRPELVDRLVELTGMTRGEAALLLAGLPEITSWEANFLPAATRHLLGLSMAEARTARDVLRDLPADHRVALLDTLMPDDPARLWEVGPDVDRLAEAWTSLFGRGRALAEDVLQEAGKALPRGEGVEAVRGLANPETCPWLRPGGLTEDNVAALALALPWLAYRLPAGDPARACLPDAHRRVLAALAHPELTVGAGYLRWEERPPPALVVRHRASDHIYCAIRPALLTGPDDPVLALFPTDREVRAVRALLSPELAALLARVGAETAAPPRYPHDPRWSVPDLVEEVARRHGVGTDAAAYYLQLLALPDPTDRNVERWAGWATAARKKLRAELVAAGPVVEAKRERAGRTAFLPGGWLQLKAPNLPIERWKADLFGLREEGMAPALIVPDRTVPDLFRAAWQRVVDGDEPRFHTLGEAR